VNGVRRQIAITPTELEGDPAGCAFYGAGCGFAHGSGDCFRRRFSSPARSETACRRTAIVRSRRFCRASTSRRFRTPRSSGVGTAAPSLVVVRFPRRYTILTMPVELVYDSSSENTGAFGFAWRSPLLESSAADCNSSCRSLRQKSVARVPRYFARPLRQHHKDLLQYLQRARKCCGRKRNRDEVHV